MSVPLKISHPAAADGLMVYSAISRVSLFEADGDTDDRLLALGEKKNDCMLC